MLGLLGVLNAALTVAGLACFLLLAGWCARGVWLGRQELRARVAREQQRVARARAVQDREWHGRQQEHDRRLRDWQARGRRFQAQPRWYGVALPADIDRVDVAGGTLAGWSALLTMLAGLRLAAGGEVTVLDLGAGRGRPGPAAAPPPAPAADPLVWVLPADLPRFDLGRGLPPDGAGRCAGRGRVGGRRPGQPARPVRGGPGHRHPGAHRRGPR